LLGRPYGAKAGAFYGAFHGAFIKGPPAYETRKLHMLYSKRLALWKPKNGVGAQLSSHSGTVFGRD